MNQTTKNHAEKTITQVKDNSHSSPGLGTWFKHHQSACKNAIKRLISTPLSSIFTIFVVAIALSLPAALQVAIKNLEAGRNTVNEQAKIALYLQMGTTQEEVNALIDQLKNNELILDIHYISPEQALEDFQQASELGNTLNTLKNNPLPAAIIVTPNTQKLNVDDLNLLIADFQELEAVELAQIDIKWLKKLFSIIDLAKHFAIGTSIFLIFAVLVLIGNTIKNLGQSFQEEIAISKLVGATDAYVRRIFLYTGLGYGLIGSITALLFVFIGVLWITPQLNALATLYNTNISIIPLDLSDMLSLMGIGTILGLGGAWVAANRLINELSL
ncbi:MAG TPA: ABC transporter permease [Gammaproteobacteria bacterium]|nr:ABC transporter permease [Gammaproteobacteria bacterium]